MRSLRFLSAATNSLISAKLSDCFPISPSPQTSRPTPQLRCTVAWHAEQSVIRFCSESSPDWLRNSL